MTSATEQPTTVRELETPAARALTDLAAIFDDLQTVLRCCERLVAELDAPSSEPDDLMLEALWTTAVLSYGRCFAGGRRGMGLTESDVTATPLRGEVLRWHEVLRELREHYAATEENPRERFSVGVAQDSAGQVSGIAITSTSQPRLDDRTVRQTGALAYELGKMVDERITAQQQHVREAANALSRADVDRLPLVPLVSGHPS